MGCMSFNLFLTQDKYVLKKIMDKHRYPYMPKSKLKNALSWETVDMNVTHFQVFWETYYWELGLGLLYFIFSELFKKKIFFVNLKHYKVLHIEQMILIGNIQIL